MPLHLFCNLNTCASHCELPNMNPSFHVVVQGITAVFLIPGEKKLGKKKRGHPYAIAILKHVLCSYSIHWLPIFTFNIPSNLLYLLETNETLTCVTSKEALWRGIASWVGSSADHIYMRGESMGHSHLGLVWNKDNRQKRAWYVSSIYLREQIFI